MCFASLHNHIKELQLNLKTNDNLNCQKIELYGSPTTKDLKKPHSSRWVGGMETQSGMGRWWSGLSHIYVW